MRVRIRFLRMEVGPCWRTLTSKAVVKVLTEAM